MECPVYIAPASLIQIKRLFSNLVQTFIQNQLTFDNSKRLTHIYFSFKTICYTSNKTEKTEEIEADEESFNKLVNLTIKHNIIKFIIMNLFLSLVAQ